MQDAGGGVGVVGTTVVNPAAPSKATAAGTDSPAAAMSTEKDVDVPVHEADAEDQADEYREGEFEVFAQAHRKNTVQTATGKVGEVRWSLTV